MSAPTEFTVDDLQAVEPDALVPRDGVRVEVADERVSQGFPRVAVYADTREALLDYVRSQWGSDDADWFKAWVEDRVREVPAAPEFVVTSSPEDPSVDPLWLGRARDGFAALNVYARSEGFAAYGDPRCPECGSTDLLWGVDEYDIEDGSYVCEDCEHEAPPETLEPDLIYPGLDANGNWTAPFANYEITAVPTGA